MHPPPTKKNICAIFVTFNPDGVFPKRIEALVGQVDHIVIVDNHSSPQRYPFVKRGALMHPHITLIKNPDNIGLAGALNQGVQFALEHGYQWILTMDHDSLAYPRMVHELIKIYQLASRNGERIGLIGANFIHEYNGRVAFEQACENKYYIKKVGIQTSGSLLSLEIYNEIGPFREDFFIDYIDTEYCLRIKQAGFQSFIACNAHMLHSIGNIRKYSITANYNALRRYYRTRNGFTLLKEYAFKEPWWVIKKIGRALMGLPFIFTLEKDRRQKMKNFFIGIQDSIKKRGGKLS